MALTPLDYNCVGNGATDDSSNFQNFLDALASGKTGIIPDGYTFLHTSNVRVRTGTKALIGQGGVIKASGSASFVIQENTTDCTLQHLIIDKNDVASPAIWCFNIARCQLLNNKILNCSGASGILLRAYRAANGGAQDCYDNLIQGNFVDCEGADDVDSAYGISIDAEIPVNTGVTPNVTYSAYSTWTHDGTSADAASAVGSLLSATYVARNNRVIGNEVIGGNYAIALFFSSGNVIANNLIRDNGAISGAVRGIALLESSSRNLVADNVITNTQSSAIHVAYGSSDNLIEGNQIHNLIADYGNSAVNGSQAQLQAQNGAKRNCFRGNKVYTRGISNAGPEFFVNIGPHCDGTSVVDNDFRGPVAKAGINIESTYHSTGALVTSYAYGLGTVGTSNATAALDGVMLERNRIELTSARAAIQIIQASTINITNLVERDNDLFGSAYTVRFSFNVSAGSISGRMNELNATPIELAASATPSIVAGRRFKRSTAGYQDITGLTGGYEGKWVEIELSGSGTLAHSSGLRLKGASNVTGVSDQYSTIALRYDGGGWVEQWRSF